MPWKETCRMKLKQEFVLAALAPGANMAELCREHGISRKTGYKWVGRFREGGMAALEDESRRPHSSPLRASGDAVMEVVALRAERPRWGPKKLRAVLLRRLADEDVPSVRTIARILERAGMVERRRRGSTSALARPEGAPVVEVLGPNDLWTVDFKGWWRAGDGARCEPLTVRDAHSRFLLCASLLSNPNGSAVRQEFERLFDRFGLPRAIQVDNGSPFACTRARGGMTTLSAWWVSLGIRFVRGRPAHPQDNGGHERMHFDMRFDVEDNAGANYAVQQAQLEVWREDFNHVRPHEALGQEVPASLFKRSPRRMARPKQPRYPANFEVRRVSTNGCIKYGGQYVRVGDGLRNQLVAVRRIEEMRVELRYYDVELGHADLKAG
jgi:transposase InsO family protein